jgi:hypothetical protein
VLEEHEAAVVLEALGGKAGGREGDPAEGFDGVDVELGLAVSRLARVRLEGKAK